MNRRERKESSFLLFTIVFFLLSLLDIAKSFVHAGLNVVNLLIFFTDSFELGIP